MNKHKLINYLFLIVALCFILLLFSSCGPNQDSQVRSVFIIYNGNGGAFEDGQPTYSVLVKQGEGLITPEPPFREGYVFTGWYLSTDFKDIDKLNLNVFRALESKTIFARWESVDTYLHPITINTYEEGRITSDFSNAKKGTIITLDVYITDVAYHIKPGSFKANDISIDISVYPYFFIMPAEPVTITAVFELKPFSITVLGASDLPGTVIIGSEFARSGDKVTVFAIPDFGYKVDNIVEIQKEFMIENNFFVMPAKDVMLSVSFLPIEQYKTYPIIIDIENSEVVITPSKRYAANGEFITLNPETSASTNYYIEQIFVNDKKISGNGFIMPESEAVITAIVKEINNSIKYNLTLSQQPALDKNYVTIASEGSTFFSGEKIELDFEDESGYIVDSILLNGIIMPIDNILMPNEDAIITVNLRKASFQINYYGETQDFVKLSHLSAKEGDIIKINFESISSNKTLVLKYWEAGGNETEIGEESYFLMPGYDITFSAIVFVTTSDENSIEIESTEGGWLEVDVDKARAEDLIEIKIRCEDNYGLSRLFYTANGEDIDLIQADLGYISYDVVVFYMPSAKVKLTAEFSECYNIWPFMNDKVAMYPNKIKAFSQEKITVNICPRNNTNISNYIFEVNDETFDFLNYDLVVQNSDIVLSCSPIAASSIAYTITFESDGKGTISRKSKIKTGIAGEKISLNISPEKGYILHSLKLKKSSEPNDTAIEIADDFIMPNYNVTIISIFASATTELYSIKNKYIESKNDYISQFGIFLRYIEGYHDIAEFFVSYTGISFFKHYIDGVLLVDCPWRSPFYVFQLNNMLLLNSFAQLAFSDFQSKNTEFIEVNIIENYVVVSIGGSAVEDFYAIKNGIFMDDSQYLLYEQLNGTYALYRYIGSSPYVVIPCQIKKNQGNTRIVSHICANAFKDSPILGLSLSNVISLGPNAFYSLTSLIDLDLSYITNLNNRALAGLDGVTKYYVSSSNTELSVDNYGVLYSKDKKEIISYPKASPLISYEINKNCVIIRDYCFANAANLEHIKFEASLKITFIGSYSFANCPNLSFVGFKSNLQNNEIRLVDICAEEFIVKENAFFLTDSLNKLFMGRPKAIEMQGINCLVEHAQVIIDMSEINKIVYAPSNPIYFSSSSISIILAIDVIELYSNHYIWGQYTDFYSQS